MKALKITIVVLVALAIVLLGTAYFVLSASLPTLNGELRNLEIEAPVTLSRDSQGTAVVQAETMQDASFALGYAHAQDRLFQMDLLRRNAAGELSELFGSIALNNDKKHRFHQFRKRAELIVLQLPREQLAILNAYTAGVNAYVAEQTVPTFEYLITQTSFKPWVPEDTILATFSMYIDLQLSQVERDFNFTGIEYYAGKDVLAFLTQPSPFQATMDFSVVPPVELEIPDISHLLTSTQTSVANPYDGDDYVMHIDVETNDFMFEEPKDIGSNNWVVSGELSYNGRGAILANDMHLGLNVPTLWYRTQLNYFYDDEDITVTGLSLPGTPLIVVGATENIAWGFTNSGIDNVDWVALDPKHPIETRSEIIIVKDKDPYLYEIPMTTIGPVKYIDDSALALKWVAHEPYAINLQLGWLPHFKRYEEALEHAKSIRVPVQNMVIADAKGNAGWQLTGAITSRTNPTNTAMEQEMFDAANWRVSEKAPANVVNPNHGRIWSANARMVSANDLSRYGNGGYALGVRQKQIADSLMDTVSFDEQTFYDLQLDNRALYLAPWHELLLSTLMQKPALYAEDISHLQEWRACACPDSIGYSLVRRFRNQLITQLLEPLNTFLAAKEISTSALWRSIEPAIWQILEQKPDTWLDPKHQSFDALIEHSYKTARDLLFNQFADGETNFESISWGNVNALTITHPLAGALGPLGKYLNMPVSQGFGDSYMPAVQSKRFGASQRLFAQPGNLENAILTVPGGQSMHPLSEYYKVGYREYVDNHKTALLPGELLYVLKLQP